ncbi:MAG: hypothetical protein IPK61_13230 [Saprospiraceae bacterium]|nr:hypothetical protein [Saprospiraceae bacterium]
MNKMNQLMDLYADGESFTEEEKDLLLDYIRRIKKHVDALPVDDDALPAHVPNASRVVSDEVVPKVEKPQPIVVVPEVKSRRHCTIESKSTAGSIGQIKPGTANSHSRNPQSC